MSRKYHITQQDIQDVLLARGQKVSVKALVEFSKSKNILVSNNEERTKLARYIATIPFDNSDIEFLYDLIEYDQRREKTTNSTVKKILAEDSIREAVNGLKEDKVYSTEVFNITSKPGAPTCIIEYEYDEEDYGKARMLQITRKKVSIEVSFGENDTVIRHPANSKCEKAVEYILNSINDSAEEPFKVKKIDLSHISSADKRNLFFDSLMKNMEGMQPDDVTDIKIAQIGQESKDPSEEEQVLVPGFIKKAAFEGSSLLLQEEYQTFKNKDFFISNMKWTAVDSTSQERVKVEFEAGFSDQANCKNFKYDVKGVYTTEKDSNIFIDKRRPATEPERIKYLALIEKASETSIEGK